MSTATGLALETLAFHGTPSANIAPIVRDGFRPGKRGSRGGAVYTSPIASFSHVYSRREAPKKRQKMAHLTLIGCRVLAHRGESWGHMHGVIEPARVLPIALLQYTSK
jgi:hypothetical protein